MNERTVYEYAIVRVVPRVEREEFINVGVAFYCKKLRYAAVKIHVDEDRLKSLYGGVDLHLVAAHLRSFQRICVGDKDAGRVAQLPQDERFRWLTAKRSTIIQCSVIHPGMCVSAEEEHDRLFRELVL